MKIEMKKTAIAVSASNHPALDILSLAAVSVKPSYRFMFEDITRQPVHAQGR